MTPKEKYQQICREAGATGLALLLLIVLWCVLGFGLSASEVMVLGLPLWALTGTVGIWLLAILLTFILVKFVFKDMALTKPFVKSDKE
jgi:uncharacterized membrane protein YhdT